MTRHFNREGIARKLVAAGKAAVADIDVGGYKLIHVGEATDPDDGLSLGQADDRYIPIADLGDLASDSELVAAIAEAVGGIDLSPYFKADGSVPLTGNVHFGTNSALFEAEDQGGVWEVLANDDGDSDYAGMLTIRETTGGKLALALNPGYMMVPSRIDGTGFFRARALGSQSLLELVTDSGLESIALNAQAGYVSINFGGSTDGALHFNGGDLDFGGNALTNYSNTFGDLLADGSVPITGALKFTGGSGLVDFTLAKITDGGNNNLLQIRTDPGDLLLQIGADSQVNLYRSGNPTPGFILTPNGIVFLTDDVSKEGGIQFDLSTGDLRFITVGGGIIDFNAIEAKNAADPTTAQSLVTRAYGDAHYDVLGAGTTAVGTHEAAGDPHPQYLTAAEGNAAYAPISVVGDFKADGSIAMTGDLTINDSTKGLVLKSPNTHRWRATISDAGVLSLTDLGV